MQMINMNDQSVREAAISRIDANHITGDVQPIEPGSREAADAVLLAACGIHTPASNATGSSAPATAQPPAPGTGRTSMADMRRIAADSRMFAEISMNRRTGDVR